MTAEDIGYVLSFIGAMTLASCVLLILFVLAAQWEERNRAGHE